MPVICPPGQQLDPNGKCRPVWRQNMQKIQEMINKYIECVKGLKAGHADANKCRQAMVEEEMESNNIIQTPVQCPPGQRPDKNGICRVVQTIAMRMPYATFA